MALKHPKSERTSRQDLAPSPIFGLEGMRIPRRTLRQGPIPPDVAYRVIHDELMLDGNARLNVATFVRRGAGLPPLKAAHSAATTAA